MMTKMEFSESCPIDPEPLSVTPGVVFPAAVDLLTAYTFATAELLFFPPPLETTTLTLQPFQFFLFSSFLHLLFLLLFLRPLRRSRLKRHRTMPVTPF